MSPCTTTNMPWTNCVESTTLRCPWLTRQSNWSVVFVTIWKERSCHWTFKRQSKFQYKWRITNLIRRWWRTIDDRIGLGNYRNQPTSLISVILSSPHLIRIIHNIHHPHNETEICVTMNTPRHQKSTRIHNRSHDQCGKILSHRTTKTILDDAINVNRWYIFKETVSIV